MALYVWWVYECGTPCGDVVTGILVDEKADGSKDYTFILTDACNLSWQINAKSIDDIYSQAMEIFNDEVKARWCKATVIYYMQYYQATVIK